MKLILTFTFAILILSAIGSCTTRNDRQVDPDQEDWISLFNGEDLSGWTPKFAGYEMGNNLNTTFRVTNGLLQTSYENYDTFIGEFGHLFYETKYSYYKLRLQYRMVGEQVSGGPGWAYANNGMMLHCQSVSSMRTDQSFPLSIEFQFLGGNGTEDRPTGNLCTPGCHVTFDGEMYIPHCMTNFSGPTYHGTQWVRAEALVLGDSIIHHIIEGDTVLTYTHPVVGGGLTGLDTTLFPSGRRMTEGFIALQAESHNTDFRSIELLDLCGCMDQKALNFKSYYVKSNPEACLYE